jgi:hypothetical protein
MWNNWQMILLKDGLELWLTLLHNTSKASPVLVGLLPRVPPLLEMGSEHLRTTIYILQVPFCWINF